LDYEVEMSLWNKFNKLYAEVFADWMEERSTRIEGSSIGK
jgi:hypothetical protein